MKRLVFFLLLAQSLHAQKGVDTTNLDLKIFADKIVKGEKDNYQRAKKALQWLSNNFNWLSTDYKTRTVKEILVRGGGNCYELSVVYMALIKELKIKYRPIAEINLHVETPRRQRDAAKLVKEKGKRFSVFGFNHNDHRWIEIFDEKNNSWIPADPTMGIIGYENWLKARAWYGERQMINKEIAKDMIVPIGIFVVGKDFQLVDNRTKHYVVDGLDTIYAGRLSKNTHWPAWVESIEGISEKCKEAFEGNTNLHEFQSEIKKIGTLYQNLKAAVPPQQLKTLSVEEKLYGLSRIWQEVNYNFVYLDKVNKEEWEGYYRNLLVSIPQTKNDYEYFRALQKFIAFLKDGHTNVFMPPYIQTMTTMFGDYRFFIKNIENRAIVERVNLSKKEEIPVGSEIVEVNGIPALKYVSENVLPYIASSTDYVLLDQGLNKILTGLEGDEYLLKIRKPSGEMVSLKVKHAITEEKAVFPAFEDKPLIQLKWHENQIAQLTLNSFEDPRIDTLFTGLLPELYKARGLIIDLRDNGGGRTDIGSFILQHFTQDSVLFHAKSFTREHLAAYKAWGAFLTAADTVSDEWNTKAFKYNNGLMYRELGRGSYPVTTPSPRIVIPTAILTSHSTASAAEDFLISADNQKHMLRIGEKSFGSTGQPYFFTINGASVRVCTKKDVYPDDREFVGYGIKPHIEVTQSYNDFITRNDAVLNKAILIIRGKIN